MGKRKIMRQEYYAEMGRLKAQKKWEQKQLKKEEKIKQKAKKKGRLVKAIFGVKKSKKKR